ncbi:MAG: LysM domain-containing protein [Chloroflexota bacterium]
MFIREFAVWRAIPLLMLMILAACGGSPDAPQISNDDFEPVPRLVQSCELIISEAIRREKCSPADNSVCLLSAEYKPDDLNVNRIGNMNIGPLTEDTELDTSTSPTLLDEGVVWRSYTISSNASGELPVTLVTLGHVDLSGITPALDALTLDTATTPDCANGPPTALLVQSERGTQANITVNGVIVTVGTTAVITAERGDEMTVRAIEGLSVVSANSVTRVVRAGEQSTVALRGLRASGEPAPATADDSDFVSQLPLTILPNRVSPGARAANPQLQEIQAGTCEVNTEWTGEHTVTRGESLSRIAPNYGLTYLELQIGNCLLNPSRLNVGQVLRVPAQAITATPPVPQTASTPADSTAIPAQATVIVVPAGSDATPTATPLPPLTADRTDITAGECTSLRWRVSSAAEVYLDETVVSSSGSRQVCPELTTVYTLRIVFADGTQQTSTTAVFVSTN